MSHPEAARSDPGPVDGSGGMNVAFTTFNIYMAGGLLHLKKGVNFVSRTTRAPTRRNNSAVRSTREMG